MSWSRMAGGATGLSALVLLSACGSDSELGKAPPRSDTPIEYPEQLSSFAVPVSLNVETIRTQLEREVPRKLYTLRQHVSNCVPSQKVKVLGAKIPYTPKLACDVAIDVSRGSLKLTGSGRDITIIMPINAFAKASNVGGVLKESANGSAVARIKVRIDVSKDWNLGGKMDLTYGWTTPPGIDFLGRRFTFTDKVDEQIRPIIAKAERQLPKELAKVNLRQEVSNVWGKAFTVVSLNRENPPVWMRITPAQLTFGGYSLQGSILRMAVGIEGTTETFVGEKPKPKPVTALPSMGTMKMAAGRAKVFVPVIASYDEIEPIILEALTKRAQRPFVLPKVGAVMTRFDAIEAYATDGGRIAVGLKLNAWKQAEPDKATHGTVWLTGEMINPDDTRTLSFRDVRVNGLTDKKVTNLLLRVVNHPAVAREIGAALTQNLDKDFNELRGKIDMAIGSAQEGDFTINAKIETLRSGSLKAAGQGLYLPVWAEGTTSVRYRPN